MNWERWHTALSNGLTAKSALIASIYMPVDINVMFVTIKLKTRLHFFKN